MNTFENIIASSRSFWRCDHVRISHRKSTATRTVFFFFDLPVLRVVFYHDNYYYYDM